MILAYSQKYLYNTAPQCLYYKIDRFRSKLVSYIFGHKHTSFDKHTSLLRNPYITDL